MKVKTANILLELQNYIMQPPVQKQDLYKKSCSADDATMDKWRDTWLSNMRENKKRFGSFKDHGLGQLFNKFQHDPIIIAGSGPSLKKNAHLLKNRPNGVRLISCLHNFHYMEDLGAEPDFYVSLDAGPVTIEEVCEGGSKSEEDYWNKTKDRALIAYIGSHPDLLRKWQGEIYLYNAPIPSDEIRDEIKEIEPFYTFVSNGGTVLGACLYIAKGYLGSQTTIFVGTDFCFSNEEKRTFHAWDSKYDKNIGQCVSAVDIFGNRVLTWGSYYNFKCWFDYVVLQVPGKYINATEGGIFGAYREGNIVQLEQMDLEDVFKLYGMHEHLRGQAETPEIESKTVLF